MDYNGTRKIWYSISVILLLVSLASLFTLGINRGIDFQSGTLFDLSFANEDVTVEEVRAVLAPFDLSSSRITEDRDGGFVIKTIELSQDVQMEILQEFENTLGTYDLMRTESVGPIIGKELARNGVLALAVASVLMVAYISVRFQFKFAIAAILCLLHDVLIMLGAFSLFQFEVESSFIAAILTIVGYSINNTIVIYDRIRENLKYAGKTPARDVLNQSIKDTMTRTINTSLTVMMVLLSMIFLGGETTRVFAIALLIGNLVGFYSSVFIAGNLWFDFKMRFKKA